jgi:hypothetical protein
MFHAKIATAKAIVLILSSPRRKSGIMRVLSNINASSENHAFHIKCGSIKDSICLS